MRLVCTEGRSDKFWEGSVAGNTLRVHFGRVGTAGQRRERICATPAAAERELAKLIEEKRRKGYRMAAEAPVEPAPATAAPARASLAFHGRPLQELAVRLGADPELLDEIELASSSPDAYLQRFSQRLGERGIHGARADLAWFALIDGLLARAKLAELDWRASPDEVREALIALDPAHRRAAWRDYVRECDSAPNPMDISSWHCMGVADRRLRTRGLALVYLSTAGDSTPVVIVPVDEVERLGQLARASGAGELGPVCGPPSVPTRFELPSAPAGTPHLRAIGSALVLAPPVALRGFFALPDRCAVALTASGSDRRWRLWRLSAAGVESEAIDTRTFPEWANKHPVDHYCALFRAGARVGVMSAGQYRLWDELSGPSVLGPVTPALFRDPSHRPPNVSFGGASDDPRVVVVSYYAVGDDDVSASAARLELDLERTELRHQWLEGGRPLVHRRRHPPLPELPQVTLRSDPYPPLAGIGHFGGSTLITTHGYGQPPIGGFLAEVFGDGSSEARFSTVMARDLRLTSCGRFVITTTDTPGGARQALVSVADQKPVVLFDPSDLLPKQRLLDGSDSSWWAEDVDADGSIRLQLYELPGPSVG